MLSLTWFHVFARGKRGRRIPKNQVTARRYRLLGVERLEPRNLLSTFTVTNTNDSGVGSLRQAILDANAASGTSTIDFAIGSGAQTIIPASALPAITKPVILDATSQPGYNGTPLIELKGTNAGNGASGFTINGGNSTIMGFAIGGFATADGINANSSGNVISANYLGTAPDGTTADPNGYGVGVGANNTIGGATASSGNLVADNTYDGIWVQTNNALIENNTVTGNGIVAGDTSGVGIYMYGGSNGQILNNTVTANGASNQGQGIYLRSCTGNMVQGNTINNNTVWGIFLNGASNCTFASNTISGNVLGIGGGGSNNTIGGATSAAGNLVANNQSAGIYDDCTGSLIEYNTVTGNGTSTSGQGIYMVGGSNAQILNNTVTGNGSSTNGMGIWLRNCTGNVVQGNKVNNNNFWGIELWCSNCTIQANTVSGNVLGIGGSGNSNNTIGGTTAAAGNLVTNNQSTGIADGSTGDLIEYNTVTGNGTAYSARNDNGDGISVGGTNDQVLNNTINSNGLGGNGVGIWLRNTSGHLIQGNTVNGNKVYGIALWTGANSITVQGNTVSSNGSSGIVVLDANNTIGGTTAGAGNVVTGNGGSGIGIDSSNNVVQGNFIGTDPAGDPGLGNSVGGIGFGGGTNNTLGGSTAAAANLISGNSGYGIVVGDGTYTTTGILIQQNYVGTGAGGRGTLLNTGGALEISRYASALVAGSLTGDVLNQGTLTLANVPAIMTVTGNYTQNAAASLNLEFAGPNAANPDYSQLVVSGTATLAGTLNLTLLNGFVPDPTQSFSILSAGAISGTYATVNYPTYAGRALFSAQYTSTSLGLHGTTYVINSTGDAASQGGGSPDTGGTVNGQPEITLRSAIQSANTLSGTQYIYFDIPGTGVQMIAPTSPLPALTTSAVIDGYTQPGAAANTLAAGDNAVLEIDLDGTNAGASASGLVINASNSIIQGLVIDHFSAEGINLSGAGHINNTVRGDFIGVDATGSLAAGNQLDGVLINAGSSNNTIGGTAVSSRNVISSNGVRGVTSGSGVDISDAGTTGNLLQGNYLGSDASGGAALGNAVDGVKIQAGASSNTIGGTAAGAGNLIVNNYFTSVEVDGNSSVGNSIRGNSIIGNGLGIDLGGDRVTLNDSLGHVGPNNLQNFPTIRLSAPGATSIEIAGELNSGPSAAYTLDFYASPKVNSSGYGEGAQYLGSTTVNTDSSGNALFDVTLPVTVTPGYAITATATDASGNTSEFSRVHVAPLSLYQTITGQLGPHDADQWTFSANAGDQLGFATRIPTDNSVVFQLTGPNGFSTTSMDQLPVLPTSGQYTLSVYTVGVAANYLFELDLTSVNDLGTPVATYSGTVPGNNFCQQFKVTAADSNPLLVTFTDHTPGDLDDVYIKQGATATRVQFDYQSGQAGAQQTLALPGTSAGTTWYILLYTEKAVAGSSMNLKVVSEPIILTGVTPSSYATDQTATLTLTGVGFVAGTQVALVADPGGASYQAQTVTLQSSPAQLAAQFDLHGVPQGSYDVQATIPGGASFSLINAFTVQSLLAGQLVTNLILPTTMGPKSPETLYVQFANVGTTALPTPTMVLQEWTDATHPAQNPQLTGVFSSWGNASQESNAVTIQAVTLQPGQTTRIPIYYDGLQNPNAGETAVSFWLHASGDNNPPTVPTASAPLPTSHDPNGVIGKSGKASSTPNVTYVPEGQPLGYQIFFENSAGTAPVQRADITEQVDPNLDWSTFQFVDFGFGLGNTRVSAAGSGHHFDNTSNEVHVTYAGYSFYVQIYGDLDTSTGLLHVYFQSLPDQVPPLALNSAAGFLPPDPNGTGLGLAFFDYTVAARTGLPTGSPITTVAQISFDGQAPMPTNQTSSTSLGTDPSKEAYEITDGLPPTCSVAALPAVERTTRFPVSWSATDDPGGSGVATYDVYVSDNGGPFTLVPGLQGTTLTQTTFVGLDQHTYAFYSVATDNVGNREAKLAKADTQTKVLVAPVLQLQAPASTTGGTPFSITVTALDQNGNPAADYRGTVHITSSDGRAILPGDYTFTAADAGIHTFNFTLKTAGSQTITFADQSGLTATATVSVASAVYVDASGNLSYTAAAGLADNLTVSLANGNYTFSNPGVTLAVSGPGAAGATGNGTSTITLPTADVHTISIDLGDGSNTLNLQSTAVATTVTNSGGGSDTTNVGNAGSMQGITGSLTVNNPTGATALILNDSGDTAGRTVTLNAGSVTGLAPATINYTPGQVSALTVSGGIGSDTFQVLGTAAGTSATVNAGGGNDTINVGSTANKLDGIQGALSVNGGSGTNTLNVLDSGNTVGESLTLRSTTLTRTGAATLTYASVTKLNVNAGSGNDMMTIVTPAPAVAVSFNGGSGTNTLTGANVSNAWTISGTNAGKVGQVSFSNVQSLVGGTAADSFKFQTSGKVTGTINGGGGTDTLDYSSLTAGVAVNLTTGTATSTGGVSNIANVIGTPGNDTLTGGSGTNTLTADGGADVLIGGSGTETFVLGSTQAAATTMTGGSGVNTLSGANLSNTWTLTGANAGTVNGIAFNGIQNLKGGTGTDSFLLQSGGSLSGTITGGSGTNTLNYSADGGVAATINLATSAATAIHDGASGGFSGISVLVGSSTSDLLIGPNATNTWSITGADAGTVSTYSFSGFENLKGGTGVDTFKLLAGGSLSGTIAGGGGSDRLDYSADGGVAATVNLATGATTAIHGGAAGGFSGISTLVASTSTSDLLIGPNATNTWSITGTDAGTVNTFSFSGIENLQGGTGLDTFKFASASANVLSITGGGAPTGQGDWLNYSAFLSSSTVTVNLTTGSATNVNGGVAGAVTGIQNVSGSASGTNNLTGSSPGNILIGGSGTNTIVGGSGNSLLIGGSGHGSITGGSGSDILIAGTTTYNAPLSSWQSSLMAILAELQSADTFAQKVYDLIHGSDSGDPNGHGSDLNSSNKLTWGISGATVKASIGAFMLSGDASAETMADWFFSNASSTITDFNNDGLNDEHNNNALGFI